MLFFSKSRVCSQHVLNLANFMLNVLTKKVLRYKKKSQCTEVYLKYLFAYIHILSHSSHSETPHQVFLEHFQLPVHSLAKFCKIIVFSLFLQCILFLTISSDLTVRLLFLVFASIHKKNWHKAPEMTEAIHGTVRQGTRKLRRGLYYIGKHIFFSSFDKKRTKYKIKCVRLAILPPICDANP